MKRYFILFIFSFIMYPLIAQVDSSLLLINKIKIRLESGENFCTLVQLYSEDDKSNYKCGELGYIEKGKFMRSYEDVMVKLKIGEISDIIKTGYGYHIIQLVDIKNENKIRMYNTRHILIKFK